MNNRIKRQLDFKLSLAGGQPHVQMYPAWIFRLTLLPLRPFSLRWRLATLRISTQLLTVGQLGTAASWVKCGVQIFYSISLYKIAQTQRCSHKDVSFQRWRHDSTANALP